MLREQKYRCSYSNLQLQIGQNAQLDHINPKAKGGHSNILSNVTWADAQVNRMKGHLTKLQMVRLITKILKHMGYNVTRK